LFLNTNIFHIAYCALINHKPVLKFGFVAFSLSLFVLFAHCLFSSRVANKRDVLRLYVVSGDSMDLAH